MNKFFYYNSLCAGSNLQSVFSIDPYISAIKELLLSELKQVVYYIEKLRGLDFDMSVYTGKVIEFIAVLIVNLDFSKDSTFIIIEDLYDNKKMLEKMYISACEKSETEPELFPETEDNLSSKDIIIKALNARGIKTSNQALKAGTPAKYFNEIMINIVLNTCNKLVELKNLNVNLIEAENSVLKLLNTSNSRSLKDEELKNIIKDFAQMSCKTAKTLSAAVMEKFGPVSKTQAPVLEKEGKAVLVSGRGFDELEKILDAAKGLNIYVYSYRTMISAFQYEKLREHPNFAGHYIRKGNDVQSDFASFPGPVFVTRNSMPKIDVIRGRVFTGTKYPAFGISKIENNNFEPLIQSALDMPGFKADRFYQNINIGFDKTEIEAGIKDAVELFKNNSIKNIVIIGALDSFNVSDRYISEFFKQKQESSYIISFTAEKRPSKCLNVNSYLDFGILYEIIEKLVHEDENIKEHIHVIIDGCSSSTVYHIINLMHLGVKNIFLGACCPNTVSPLLLEGLEKMFDIKPITEPGRDWEIISG